MERALSGTDDIEEVGVVTPEQIQRFKQDGFFVWPEVFSAAEIDAIRRLCDGFDDEYEHTLAQIGSQGISRAGEIAFTAHLAARSPELARFVVSPPFIDIVTTLIGPDVSLYWDQTVYKRPETARDFPWHQDNGYTPIVPEQYVTCWIPLEDISLDMGPVWVLPKSHLQGTVEHRDTPLGKQCYFGPDPGVPVPIAKGAMIVFSSLLFHRSSANLSAKTRPAYIVQYCAKEARHGDTGLPFQRPVLVEQGRPVPLTESV